MPSPSTVVPTCVRLAAGVRPLVVPDAAALAVRAVVDAVCAPASSRRCPGSWTSSAETRYVEDAAPGTAAHGEPVESQQSHSYARSWALSLPTSRSTW